MDHWARVRDPLTENYNNDLSWLITLRAVKVRASLHNWGYIDADRCASCNGRETINHCFLLCPRIGRVWAHFAPALSALLGSPFLATIPTVFFSRWGLADRKRNGITLFLVKSILYAIWSFRNKATFHNGNEDHRAIIKYSLHNIQSRIRLDFSRLSPSRFRYFWATPAIFAMASDVLYIYL